MHLQPKTVSSDFRRFLADSIPALDRDPAYWRLAEELLFGTIADEATGRIRLSRERLAAIEGKESQLMGHHYVADRFLSRFSRDVAPIVVGPWRYTDGLARTVQNEVFPPEVLDAAAEERRLCEPDRVYFATGQPFTRRAQAAVREAARSEAVLCRHEAPNAATGMLLDYMNSRPSDRFSRMLHHLAEAQAAAEMAACPAEVQTEELRNKLLRVRDRQLSLLGAIRDQPQPFYMPTAHSARIFSLNESVLRCTRAVRKILTQDWASFDLRSAQLAICAAEWQVVPVLRFLETGRSIWDEFFVFFGVDPDPDLKSVFKQALYAICFGAANKGIFTIFERAGHTRGEARFLLTHPLMQAMLDARQEQFRRIIANGGAEDCFGAWLPIPAARYGKPGHYLWARNPRSVLAQLAQSRELQLMLPIVELARRTDQFSVMLWLHDGCSIAFRDAVRRQLWSGRIVGAVNRQAAALGVQTELERSDG